MSFIGPPPQDGGGEDNSIGHGTEHHRHPSPRQRRHRRQSPSWGHRTPLTHITNPWSSSVLSPKPTRSPSPIAARPQSIAARAAAMISASAAAARVGAAHDSPAFGVALPAVMCAQCEKLDQFGRCACASENRHHGFVSTAEMRMLGVNLNSPPEERKLLTFFPTKELCDEYEIELLGSVDRGFKRSRMADGGEAAHQSPPPMVPSLIPAALPAFDTVPVQIKRFHEPEEDIAASTLLSMEATAATAVEFDDDESGGDVATPQYHPPQAPMPTHFDERAVPQSFPAPLQVVHEPVGSGNVSFPIAYDAEAPSPMFTGGGEHDELSHLASGGAFEPALPSVPPESPFHAAHLEHEGTHKKHKERKKFNTHNAAVKSWFNDHKNGKSRQELSESFTDECKRNPDFWSAWMNNQPVEYRSFDKACPHAIALLMKADKIAPRPASTSAHAQDNASHPARAPKSPTLSLSNEQKEKLVEWIISTIRNGPTLETYSYDAVQSFMRRADGLNIPSIFTESQLYKRFAEVKRDVVQKYPELAAKSNLKRDHSKKPHPYEPHVPPHTEFDGSKAQLVTYNEAIAIARKLEALRRNMILSEESGSQSGEESGAEDGNPEVESSQPQQPVPKPKSKDEDIDDLLPEGAAADFRSKQMKKSSDLASGKKNIIDFITKLKDTSDGSMPGTTAIKNYVIDMSMFPDDDEITSGMTEERIKVLLEKSMQVIGIQPTGPPEALKYKPTNTGLLKIIISVTNTADNSTSRVNLSAWKEYGLQTDAGILLKARELFVTYVNDLRKILEQDPINFGAGDKKPKFTAPDFESVRGKIESALKTIGFEDPYYIRPETYADRVLFASLVKKLCRKLNSERGRSKLKEFAEKAFREASLYEKSTQPYEGNDTKAFARLYNEGHLLDLFEFKPAARKKKADEVDVDAVDEYDEPEDAAGREDEDVPMVIDDTAAPPQFPKWLSTPISHTDADAVPTADALLEPNDDGMLVKADGAVVGRNEVSPLVQKLVGCVDETHVSYMISLPVPNYWASFHERIGVSVPMTRWYDASLKGIERIGDDPDNFFWTFNLDTPWLYINAEKEHVAVTTICVDLRKKEVEEREKHLAAYNLLVEQADDKMTKSKAVKSAYGSWLHQALYAPPVCFAVYEHFEENGESDWVLSDFKDLPEDVKDAVMAKDFPYGFDLAPEPDQDEPATTLSDNHKKALQLLFKRKGELIDDLLQNVVPKHKEARARGLLTLCGTQKPMEYPSDYDAISKRATHPETYGLLGMPMIQELMCREFWENAETELPDFVEDAFYVVQDDAAYIQSRDQYAYPVMRDIDVVLNEAKTQQKEETDIPDESKPSARKKRDPKLLVQKTFELWRKLHDTWTKKKSLTRKLKDEMPHVESLRKALSLIKDRNSEAFQNLKNEFDKAASHMAAANDELIAITDPMNVDDFKNSYEELLRHFMHQQYVFSYTNIQKQLEESTGLIDQMIVTRLRSVQNEDEDPFIDDEKAADEETSSDDDDDDDSSSSSLSSSDEDDDEDEEDEDDSGKYAILKRKRRSARLKINETKTQSKEARREKRAAERDEEKEEEADLLAQLQERVKQIRKEQEERAAQDRQAGRDLILYTKQETHEDDECEELEALLEELTSKTKKNKHALTPTHTYIEALRWLEKDSAQGGPGLDVFLPQDEPLHEKYAPNANLVLEGKDGGSGAYEMWTANELAQFTLQAPKPLQTLTSKDAYAAFTRTKQDEMDVGTILHHKRCIKSALAHGFDVKEFLSHSKGGKGESVSLFMKCFKEFKAKERGLGVSRTGHPRSREEKTQSMAVNALLDQAMNSFYTAHRYEQGLHEVARLLCELSTIKLFASDPDNWVIEGGKCVDIVELDAAFNIATGRRNATPMPLQQAIRHLLKEKIPKVQAMLDKIKENPDLNQNRKARSDLSTKKASGAAFRHVGKMSELPTLEEADEYVRKNQFLEWYTVEKPDEGEGEGASDGEGEGAAEATPPPPLVAAAVNEAEGLLEDADL